jgi:poly(A) polymerase
MRDAGVLDFDDATLERLRAYGARAARPNFLARLALIVAEGGMSSLQARWRLSNEEVARAEAILAAARLLEQLKVNDAAYRYPAALSDAIEVASVLAGWTEAGKSAVVEQLGRVSLSPFPLSGDDLIAAGISRGPALGAELKRLEQLWIDSGFSLDRADLLARLRR